MWEVINSSDDIGIGACVRLKDAPDMLFVITYMNDRRIHLTCQIETRLAKDNLERLIIE